MLLEISKCIHKNVLYENLPLNFQGVNKIKKYK